MGGDKVNRVLVIFGRKGDVFYGGFLKVNPKFYFSVWSCPYSRVLHNWEGFHLSQPSPCGKKPALQRLRSWLWSTGEHLSGSSTSHWRWLQNQRGKQLLCYGKGGGSEVRCKMVASISFYSLQARITLILLFVFQEKAARKSKMQEEEFYHGVGLVEHCYFNYELVDRLL